MEGDSTRVKSEKSTNLYEKINNIYSKITAEDIFDALILILVAFISCYIIKLNHAFALFVVAILYIFYLLCDITFTKEENETFGVIFKKFLVKWFFDKSNNQESSKTKTKEINNEMLEIVNGELIKRKENLMNENDQLYKANEELMKQKQEMLKEKERLLGILEDGRSQNNVMFDITMKLDELWKDKESMMEELDFERKNSDELLEKYENLVKEVESERAAYKTWRERESTTRKKLEDEKEKLESKLKENKMEFENFKRCVNAFLENIHEDKAQFMKLINNKMTYEIKREIEANTNDVCARLGQYIKASFEQKEVSRVEEKCQRLETERDNMMKMVAKLEEERGRLNESLIKEKAQKVCDAKEYIEGKFESVVSLSNIIMEKNGREFEKVLEKQDVMCKLIEDVKASYECYDNYFDYNVGDGDGNGDGDDGYEVVEEN